jgi:hypothetical protein
MCEFVNVNEAVFPENKTEFENMFIQKNSCISWRK